VPATTLTLLTGPTVAVPAPPLLLDALDHVEVTNADSGRSGFQLVFTMGRSGAADRVDFPLLSQPLLQAFHRVVLVVVSFGGVPQVLMDGVVTHREVTPGTTPGTGTLTVTGEDVSLMMDLEEKAVERTAQSEVMTATLIIGQYSTYGLIPQVTTPSAIEHPLPQQRTPMQRGTDLAHLNAMARRFGFVCYVVPGPAVLTNTVHWGPPVRDEAPQRALSVDMGAETNVQQISFRSAPLAPTKVTGSVQDPQNGQQAVRSGPSKRPQLAAFPDWLVNEPNVRTTLLRGSGLTAAQAKGRAQGAAEASTDSLTATGTLDALRYGDLLTARGIVGLRGAGRLHDGKYYVKQVTHRLRRGEYTQQFTLTREGLGSTVLTVSP
jgi:hypothetical protein